jgi:hypothetical protein
MGCWQRKDSLNLDQMRFGGASRRLGAHPQITSPATNMPKEFEKNGIKIAAIINTIPACENEKGSFRIQ